YYNVHLTTTTRLRDLLEQLLVLIPVLDDTKHYWVGPDEIDRLLRRGGEWLAGHPERESIAKRYLRHDRALTNQALERLLGVNDIDEIEGANDNAEEAVERTLSLNDQRIEAVVAAIKDSGARKVLDLGCGSAKIVQTLLADT